MDELKIKLSTRFMRGIVAKLIKKAIFKQTGYEVDIQINEIDIETKDGKVHLHTSVDADVNYEDFRKILKNVNLD